MRSKLRKKSGGSIITGYRSKHYNARPREKEKSIEKATPGGWCFGINDDENLYIAWFWRIKRQLVGEESPLQIFFQPPTPSPFPGIKDKNSSPLLWPPFRAHAAFAAPAGQPTVNVWILLD